jgi:hypothetical protein
MVEFTMLVPVWLPLLIGTLWIGSSMIRGQQVTQMARDLASMYSRDSTNLNFAAAPTTSSNAVLDDITKQLGTLTSTGNGVVIFSTITYAGNSFCASGGSTYGATTPSLSHTGNCTNYGHFVFTQQYVQGNTSLLTSRFGTPPASDMDANYNVSTVTALTDTADVSTFNLISPVPQENGSDGYQSGQPIYVVEVYFQSQGLAGYTKGGDYAYAVF